MIFAAFFFIIINKNFIAAKYLLHSHSLLFLSLSLKQLTFSDLSMLPCLLSCAWCSANLTTLKPFSVKFVGLDFS